MCRTQYVLALLVLYVGLAYPWDIAVSLGDELVFYSNGSETSTVRFKSQNLTALVYDEVHNMILYVDKQSDNDALCGYSFHSMENKCFIKRVGSNIHSIAFDPATDTLFFTDTDARSINWISLKPGSNNNVYGNLLIKMDDRTPSDIAVDSCKGYIYWSYLEIGTQSYMERARFNGSDREVLIRYLPIFSFAMDPQTRNIYYFEGCETCMYEFLSRRDFDGKSYKTYITNRHHSTPKELTVSKDYIYWMNSSEGYSTVWHLPKNRMEREEPKEIVRFYVKSPLGIVANYKIKDQTQGLQDCEVLSSLIPKITVTNNLLNIQQTTETEQTTEYTTFDQLFCVQGTKVSETSVCKCIPGYIGERCDVSVCENYCLQGDCSFNDEGLPKCRCNAGYSGERCEVYACQGYCLNNGDCSLNENDEPVCQCVGNHEGTRCEAVKEDTFTFTSTPTLSAERNPTLAELLSKCLNYCLQGICSFTDDGPLCRCNAGYSGERCEVYACHGYCLNNGICSLNEEDEPFCQCVDNHEGIRCESAINDTFTNTPFDLVKRNLTLADLLSNWRKPTSKMFITVEV